MSDCTAAAFQHFFSRRVDRQGAQARTISLVLLEAQESQVAMVRAIVPIFGTLTAGRATALTAAKATATARSSVSRGEALIKRCLRGRKRVGHGPNRLPSAPSQTATKLKHCIGRKGSYASPLGGRRRSPPFISCRAH